MKASYEYDDVTISGGGNRQHLCFPAHLNGLRIKKISEGPPWELV